MTRMKQIPLAIGPEPARDLRELPARRQRRGARAPASARRPARRRSTCGARPAAARRICCTRCVERAAAARRSRSAGSTPPTPRPGSSERGCDWSCSTTATRSTPRSSRPPSRCSSTRPARGVPVVAAGRVPPVDLPLREDLRTPPRLGPRVRARSRWPRPRCARALRREADRRGIFLSDEVMDYLLTRFARDLKHLMALLDRLDGFSLADQARDHRAAAQADAGRGGDVSAQPLNLRLCFDLDHTLLPIDSDHAWGEFMHRRSAGSTPPRSRARNDAFYAAVQGRHARHRTPTSPSPPRRCASAAPAEHGAAHARFMREVIAPALRPAALALVRAHRDARRPARHRHRDQRLRHRADRRAPSASTQLIAVRARARRRRHAITGRIARRAGLPRGQGRARRSNGWRERGLGWADFERISVYSDSPNDLPLLEQATDPVATNPSPALEAIARERGWRILKLFDHDQEIHRQAARQVGAAAGPACPRRQARRGAEERARHRPGAGRRARASSVVHDAAAEAGYEAYIVGGAVRDLLRRPAAQGLRRRHQRHARAGEGPVPPRLHHRPALSHRPRRVRPRAASTR